MFNQKQNDKHFQHFQKQNDKNVHVFKTKPFSLHFHKQKKHVHCCVKKACFKKKKKKHDQAQKTFFFQKFLKIQTPRKIITFRKIPEIVFLSRQKKPFHMT